MRFVNMMGSLTIASILVACGEPQPEPEPETGRWIVIQSTNPLDDSTRVVALLRASEGAGGVSAEPITLTARCQSNSTEVYINWHDFLVDDEQRVIYRFPPTDAVTESWEVDADNNSTSVRRAIPFLRRMVESDRLVVQTTPYIKEPSTAIFDLTGAQAALEPIAEVCEWTL